MIKKIGVFVIIIALVIIVLNLPEKEEEEFNDFNIQNIDYSARSNDVGSFYTKSYEIDLTLIKEKLMNSDIFDVIPEDAVIAMQFFDGNGYITDNGLTLYGSGDIRETIDENYDFKMLTGDYYVRNLESKSICELYKTIKENNDYNVEYEGSKVALTWKYKKLMSYCLL